MTDPAILHQIARAGIIVSVYICLRIATAFLQKSPRLFSACSLLAVSWAMLIDFYSTHDIFNLENTIAPLLSSFLYVYIGGLLVSESKDGHDGLISILQSGSVWLVLVVVGAATLPFGSSIPLRQKLDAMNIAMILLGFYGFWIGYKVLILSIYEKYIMMFVLIIYGVSNIVFFCMDLAGKCLGPEETFYWVIIFAVFKVILSLLFCFGLSKFGMTDSELRNPGASFLIGLPPFPLRERNQRRGG